jgi:phosphoribosylglycinamide formyltransferase-1/phosphoribosylamine--glycine ligase/phosphoribosylglycinamide formyltransferase/phosphoribosylformylglycinamidine cyclo-ligase
MLSPDPDAVLAKLRALALALPSAAERLSHGSPGFYIDRGKFFAYFSHNHHGDGDTAVCVKTTGRDEQDMLIEAAPRIYSWPAYIGPAGWIAIDLGGDDVDWNLVEARLWSSWGLVAPKRLLSEHAPPA